MKKNLSPRLAAVMIAVFIVLARITAALVNRHSINESSESSPRTSQESERLAKEMQDYRGK